MILIQGFLAKALGELSPLSQAKELFKKNHFAHRCFITHLKTVEIYTRADLPSIAVFTIPAYIIISSLEIALEEGFY